MKNTHTLKDYVVLYQEGDEEVLIDLIQLRGKDGGNKLFLNDKKLNDFLQKTLTKYQYNVDRSEIEAFMLEFLINVDEDGNKIGILDKIDTTQTPSQIVSYVSHSWNGFIKDKLSTLLFNENTTTDQSPDQEGGEDAYSIQDNVSYSEWEEIAYDTSYERYLEVVGGLQQVLTSRQYEVTSLSSTLSQRQIAAELDIAETTVSNTMKQAHNKLKKSYTNWRALELLSSKEGKTQNDTIKSFLDEIDKITKYDQAGTFDYFSYIIDFLIENKTKDDFRLDLETLQKNKVNTGITIIGIVEDNIKRTQHNLVERVLEVYVNRKDKGIVSGQDRNRFSKAIMNSLSSHLDKNKQSITEGIESIVDTLGQRNNERLGRISNDDYKEVIKLLA